MATNELHPAQTLDGAKRAAAVLQSPIDSKAGGEPAYLDMGAGLVLSLNADSTFTMASLERGGRELLHLTAQETRALYLFWLPICTEAIMQQMAASAAERQAKREAEPPAPAPVVHHPQYPQTMALGELYTAPNCEASILTHPPRVKCDPEGMQRLELHGFDGWTDHGVVEEVTRLERHGLVLVATDTSAYLMGAADFDSPLE